MILRTVLAVVALSAMAPYALGAAARSDRAALPSGPVLLYHHISETTPPSTSTSPSTFEAHLRSLEQHGFAVWPLEKLTEAILTGQPTPARVVAISFDDAYRSIYQTAYPLLKARGWPFTVFVATDLVGRNDHYLSWADLGAMAATGATIGNHTDTHLHMVRRKEEESEAAWLNRMRAEMARADRLIRKHIGRPPGLFAYPYGEYTATLAKLAAEYGYYAFGQQSGPIGPRSDPQVLPRFPVGGPYGDLDSFVIKVRSQPFPLADDHVRPPPILPHDTDRPQLILRLVSDGRRYSGMTCFASGQGSIPVDHSRPGLVTVASLEPVAIGRSRYNCTMPAANGTYHWYSQLWMRRRGDGSWYAE